MLPPKTGNHVIRNKINQFMQWCQLTLFLWTMLKDQEHKQTLGLTLKNILNSVPEIQPCISSKNDPNPFPLKNPKGIPEVCSRIQKPNKIHKNQDIPTPHTVNQDHQHVTFNKTSTSSNKQRAKQETRTMRNYLRKKNYTMSYLLFLVSFSLHLMEWI